MKITKIIVAALVMLSTTASVNAEVTEVIAPAEVAYVQLPPPPPRPSLKLRRPPAPRRVVRHRRRPVIKLPHIKLPRHPGPPPAPPRP